MGEARDVVSGMYDAFIAGRWEEQLGFFAPDVVVDLSRSGIPDVGVYHGREGLVEGWRRWRGVWADYEVEVEELVEKDDSVLALTVVQATSRGQGLRTELQGTDLLRVRNGAIAEFAIYLDRDRARHDAGF